MAGDSGDSPPCQGINHSLQLTTYFTLHSKLDTRCPCIFYIFTDAISISTVGCESQSHHMTLCQLGFKARGFKPRGFHFFFRYHVSGCVMIERIERIEKIESIESIERK